MVGRPSCLPTFSSFSGVVSEDSYLFLFFFSLSLSFLSFFSFFFLSASSSVDESNSGDDGEDGGGGSDLATGVGVGAGATRHTRSLLSPRMPTAGGLIYHTRSTTPADFSISV